MDLDNLNKWLFLASNVGVIAGIVFLAVETQQNNELLETQIRLTRSDSVISMTSLVASNPELATIIAKVNLEEELSPAESAQYVSYTRAVFRTLEKSYEEIIRGRLDGESTILSMKAVMQGNGWIESWDAFKTQLPTDFVEWFELNILD